MVSASWHCCTVLPSSSGPSSHPSYVGLHQFLSACICGITHFCFSLYFLLTTISGDRAGALWYNMVPSGAGYSSLFFLSPQPCIIGLRSLGYASENGSYASLRDRRNDVLHYHTR